jgi:hypothetical protein
MEEKNKMEEKIMAEIKSGKIKLRSRYIFLAEKLGLGSAFLLSTLLAVLFVSLILYYLKESDNLDYLSFGSMGFFAFLESFPYLLVISTITFIFITALILKKSDITYKKSFTYITISLIGFVIIAGGGLAFTNIGEQIEQETFSSRPTGIFFQPFLQYDFMNRTRSVAGRISEIGKDYIIIQTPRDIVKVNLNAIKKPLQKNLTEGMFVIIIGERQGNLFRAYDLRLVGNEENRIIQHGVRQRFGIFPPPPGILPPPQNY